MRRAGELERRRLGETFERLCRIESPSGAEGALAVELERELGAIGAITDRDAAGNVLARVNPGGGEGDRSLLLCAHMDTVPLAAPVEPVLRAGGWENANAGVLGADNKAAVAVLLELARHCAATAAVAPGGLELELLFTVEEERALVGAREFDVGALRAGIGYVFDHASPIGELVVSSPTYFRLEATLQGAAAHAGVRPQDGRSAILAAALAIAAMRLGRLDEQTTANVGVIAGGEAENIVPERCVVRAEARSLDPQAAERTVSEMVEHLQDAANRPHCACDLDVVVEKLFDGYQTPSRSPALALAREALADCGYSPREIATGGASDANVLAARGIDCVNLANGTERNHQPDERVSVDALEGMLDVGLALLGRAAA